MTRRPYMFESPRTRRRRVWLTRAAAVLMCLAVAGSLAWAVVYHI